MTDRAFLYLALACYGGACLLTVRRLRRSSTELHRLNVALMLGGFVLQTFGMLVRGEQIGRCPLTNLQEVQVFLAWAAVLFYLLIGPAYRVSFLGAFTAPVVLVLGLLGSILPAHETGEALKRSPWVEAHAAIAIIAFGAFTLGAVSAYMYLVQERQLKSRRPTPALLLLPAVDQLDTMVFRLLLLGFGMYSVGMIGGFVSNHAVGHTTLLKTGWASAVWLAYAVLLALRGFGRWRGRRFAWASILVFVLTLVGLWGVVYAR